MIEPVMIQQREQGQRAFIPVIEGPKRITGLVIEADGWHAMTINPNTRTRPCLYKGKPYTPHRLMAHVRRWKPATKGARKLIRRLEESK